MLVNLTPIENEIKRRYGVAKEHGFTYIPQKDPKWLQETGIYQNACPFNFANEEFEETTSLTSKQKYSSLADKACYGVADSIAQIKEFYKEEIEDQGKKYFINITPVWQDKGNEDQGGGWRWHKWGPYIGKLNPQCEYLDDEDFGDDFEYILVFHIIDVTDSKGKAHGK